MGWVPRGGSLPRPTQDLNRKPSSCELLPASMTVDRRMANLQQLESSPQCFRIASAMFPTADHENFTDFKPLFLLVKVVSRAGFEPATH